MSVRLSLSGCPPLGQTSNLFVAARSCSCVSLVFNAEKEDDLVSQALRYPCDPEDKTMPGHSLGMHSPIPVVPVPWAQPLKNPKGMPIKAHRIHPTPEQPLTARATPMFPCHGFHPITYGSRSVSSPNHQFITHASTTAKGVLLALC